MYGKKKRVDFLTGLYQIWSRRWFVYCSHLFSLFFLPVLSSQFSPRSVTCCEMYSSFVWLLIRSHVVNYETNCKWVYLFCFEKPTTTWPERYNKYWIYTITTWHDDMLSKPDSICALTLSLNSLEKSQLNKTVGLELTVPNSKLFFCCCCCS